MSKKNLTKTDKDDQERTIKAKEIFLKAFRHSLGIITPACKAAKICRQTYYDWLENDQEFKQAVEDVGEEQVDFVEGALFKNIKAEKENSINFYLSTRGKNRGYQRNYKHEGDFGVNHNIEQAPQLIAGIKNAFDNLGTDLSEFEHGDDKQKETEQEV